MFRKILVIFIFLIASNVSLADPAPAFNLDSDNGKVALADLKGQLVYVDFWATWCTPCRKSFPWMNEMHNKYKDKGLKIVAINLDNKRKRAKHFLKKYPAEFTILYDPEGKSADDYKVRVMPSSYFVDAQGNLVGKHFGFRTKDTDKLEKEIRSLLKL